MMCIMFKNLMIVMISMVFYIHAADDRQKQISIELFNALEAKASPEQIITIVQCGANVNAKNSNLSTPCHLAATYDRYDCIDILCRNGADVNAKNRNGNTPLHSACSNGSLRTAQMLLMWGARSNEKNRWGINALTMAQTYGYKNIVDYIEDYEKFPEIKEPESD
jgi:ankyrin repeat protein